MGGVHHVYDRLYIGGRWVAPATDAVIEVVNPHTEELIGHAPEASPADVDRAVAAARTAFDDGDWPHVPPPERAEAVRRLAAAYAERVTEMTELIISEMGSPRWFAELGQAAGAVRMIKALLRTGETFDWEEERPGRWGTTLVRREPVGVVGAITPWNVPQVVIIPKLVPALLSGCTVVVKPSPQTPLDALLLAEIVDAADLPAGVVSILPGGRAAGEHLVSHPGVDKIAFTGSTAVGRRIGAVCGEQLKRCSLELGGKSAAVVLDDADPAQLATGLQFASFLNNGQACVAQSRVLAPVHRYDEVVESLAAMVEGLTVGDPGDPDTFVGPLVSRAQQERVRSYVAIGESEGAKAVVGGRGLPAGLERGWYVRPTLFAGVDNTMRVAQEEIFGPVLCVIPYRDEEDAIRLANDSAYGLAGSVWTADPSRGVRVARRIRTGTFGINQYAPDLAAPFGGVKASGLGREYGTEGLGEYVEHKSVYGVPGGG